MKRRATFIFAILFLFFFQIDVGGSCIIKITKNKDLKGQEWELPEDVTLVFNGGVIKNGTVIGNHTKIKSQGVIFDNVKIEGSWDVPLISTSMFANLKYENALKNVFALASKDKKNKIVIGKGDYVVTAKKGGDVCLPIISNTEVIINGTIRLLPNNYKMYEIIRVAGENISIKGKGTIIGDKHTHTGTEGEWGMGIKFHQAFNASVTGLTIKDCWGDCIYVGGNSKIILIENCKLDHGRRQGISVTKADGVTIRKCKITNVGGTAPEYAIDLEPNANDTVGHVLIENVEVNNCKGGFLSYKSKKSPRTTIGDIVIRNCKIDVTAKHPICLRRCQSALVENCVINTTNAKTAVYAEDIGRAVIRKNTINIKKNVLSTLKNSVSGILGQDEVVPIHVGKATKKIVEHNVINEK